MLPPVGGMSCQLLHSCNHYLIWSFVRYSEILNIFVSRYLYITSNFRTSATDAIAQAGTNTYCTSDYLMVMQWIYFVLARVMRLKLLEQFQIPGGSLYGTATLYQEATSSATVNPLINKACGRFIGTHKIIASKTVCSKYNFETLF